ncbi:hypothetical protein D187_010443 [Cystobacter fuscus DSM 2262]|uniref:DUF4956 domain-containing protein n=1 Tax=Cystobacter fuscus (strain ATCC 25194 / DSM 2262 / NBRC 100088 / M29) TaxID=1242864 RepID=S9QKL0_CYSF2|nr:DUF4956 domain-containing protein [Cystobacter fuscus]EPX61824.1 hypothetical protein D187_010443 [Cystobacter fuscus DSM 2262]
MPPLEMLTRTDVSDPHELFIPEALLRFSLALVLGALLAYRPWRRWMPSAPVMPQETAHTQLLIAVAGAVMTTVIGDSMSRAFGLVGLGGFIRFRSGIKDTRDAAVMFVLIGVGMSCGLGAFRVAICATGFLGAVLVALDLTAQRRPQWVKLSLSVEDLGAALPPLRALHPDARMLALEQVPASRAGTAVFELALPERMDGFQLLEGLRGALPGVRSASIDEP